MPETMIFNNFDITVEDSEEFAEELEKLCKSHAVDGNWGFDYKVEE